MASPRPRQAYARRIPLFSKEGRELLSGAGLPHSGGGGEQPGLDHSPGVDHTHSAREPGCLSCHVIFGNREEQVDHYKLDWHRYNLKKKLKGLEGVDQDQFERISGECHTPIITDPQAKFVMSR